MLSPYEVRYVLWRVQCGLASVRAAAEYLDMTVDQVCMAVFGRVTL